MRKQWNGTIFCEDHALECAVKMLDESVGGSGTTQVLQVDGFGISRSLRAGFREEWDR